MKNLSDQLKRARQAFYFMGSLSSAQRQKALGAFCDLILQNKEHLLKENAKDLKIQKGKISDSLYGRLKLDASKLDQLSDGLKELMNLPDPVGTTLWKKKLDDKLILSKISVPLGVLAVIFESRPDVIPQILGLVLKTGNAVILKGGSEAKHSNRAFMDLVDQLNKKLELPAAWAQLVETREEVHSLLNYPEYVDLVIPRGSNELVRKIMESSKIPVLGHAEGICHVYVDESADLKKALDIVYDAKAQYPSACNSMETLLVHSAIGKKFIPQVLELARREKIKVYGCERSRKLWPELKAVKTWSKEYGELAFSLKLVAGLDEAIAHINTYGSHHTDAIVARDGRCLERFFQAVDSANVFANASTRFADGFRYGFGAEVGISTGRLPPRGPVGMEGLVSYKYQLLGEGQIVAQYMGPKAKKFLHQDI